MVASTLSWVLHIRAQKFLIVMIREKYLPAFSREKYHFDCVQNILFSVAKSYPQGKLLYSEEGNMCRKKAITTRDFLPSVTVTHMGEKMLRNSSEGERDSCPLKKTKTYSI